MATYDIETPVLIVGGGGFGLTTALCLADAGVPSVLVERHVTPSPMPKARYLNMRAMEIFRQHGIADAIYERSLPIEYIRQTRWITSLGGDGPYDRRLLFKMDVFGGGEQAAHYRENSPCESTIYPQVRLEPLMHAHVEGLGPTTMLYHHDFTGFEQDAEGVTATIVDRATGRAKTVRARYLVGADGGKTIGPMLGLKMEGTPELVDMVTMYFRADLSRYLDDDHTFAYWMANPDQGDTGSWSSGVLGKLGPTKFDRHSEEWMFHFSFKSDDPERFNEDKLLPRMRALMKIPDLAPQVLGIGHWIVQGVLADRYRFGRVLVGGDSAHRHTPTNGLGLNSAIQDAHNLAWKLAMVVKGRADDSLLDSYETERRPAAKRNVDWALFTFSNHQLTGAAIGLFPNDPARSRANFTALLAQTPDGEARRYRFDEVMKAHRTEYQAIDLEIGIRYALGAFVHDGTPPLPFDPTGRTYVPTTRPGHRLPHAFVERDGRRVSTLDLVPVDGFALIVGRVGSPWPSVAQAAAEAFGVRIDVTVVADDAGVRDPTHAWRRIREIGDDGVLLVRPDQVIAWRAIGARTDPAGELTAVLRTVLARPPGGAAAG